jgi:hypothetical protein
MPGRLEEDVDGQPAIAGGSLSMGDGPAGEHTEDSEQEAGAGRAATTASPHSPPFIDLSTDSGSESSYHNPTVLCTRCNNPADYCHCDPLPIRFQNGTSWGVKRGPSSDEEDNKETRVEEENNKETCVEEEEVTTKEEPIGRGGQTAEANNGG